MNNLIELTRPTMRTLHMDKDLVLQHELGHFICLFRSLFKYDKSALDDLFNNGIINIKNDDSGYFAYENMKKYYKDENIMLNCLIGGMFFRLYYDRKHNERNPKKIRKSFIDRECYYGGGISDMTKAINIFGQDKVYRAFRRMKEWIGPYDIEMFNECFGFCSGKDKIEVKDLMHIINKYYQFL